MRFYESLGYLNSHNNNNISGNSNYANHYNGNSNLNNANAGYAENTGNNTVKTFTTNGNYQVKSTISYQSAYSTDEIDGYNGDYTEQGLEAVLNNAIFQTIDTNCFYGSQRRLKSRENVNDVVDDDGGNLNGNQVRVEVQPFDDSADIEAEINHLISRSNLCRKNFEVCNGDGNETSDDCGNQFMDEEGKSNKFPIVFRLTLTPQFRFEIFFRFNVSEEFFTHSKLISETLTTNSLKYPRGIINPNYPGFQHLAHTLSEHFIDHHQNQGNMSDSDFSEVECDFPSDSITQSTDESINNNIIIINQNNPFYDDTNGNNIIKEYQTATDIHFKKVEEVLRTVFETNSVHLMAAIELFSEKESLTRFGDDEFDFQQEEDKCLSGIKDCDLKTYLRHYDNATAIDIDPPPDVIQKSSSSDCGFETIVAKPDILLDVNGDSGKKAVIFLNVEEPGSNCSITPVDIVGNFEQEVERELGLLVDGYKSNSVGSEDEGFADITENSEDLQSSTEKLFEKVKNDKNG